MPQHRTGKARLDIFLDERDMLLLDTMIDSVDGYCTRTAMVGHLIRTSNARFSDLSLTTIIALLEEYRDQHAPRTRPAPITENEDDALDCNYTMADIPKAFRSKVLAAIEDEVGECHRLDAHPFQEGDVLKFPDDERLWLHTDGEIILYAPPTEQPLPA